MLTRIATVIRYEQRDLWDGDIPIFTAPTASRNLWSSRGERAPDFFAVSGLELAKGRLGAFSEDDLNRQIGLIWAALAEVSSELFAQEGDR